MKILRSKRVNKTLSFYANNFGFRKPYQILLDGTICSYALENKVNLKEQLPKYLGASVKLLTTPCAIIETESLGLFGATLIAKQFPTHRCGHEGNPVSGSKCLRSMVHRNKKDRYIIGTQDRELQEKLRLIPGAPILYIHNQAPTLEAPSAASTKRSEKISQQKFLPDKQSGENIAELKRRVLGVEENIEKVFKKKKIKGPNPLSCKKKKKKATESSKPTPGTESEGKIKKKRQRKRVKLPEHVKEHIKLQVGKS